MRGVEIADVAVSEGFCGEVERFSDEEQQMEVVRPGKKCQHICGQ